MAPSPQVEHITKVLSFRRLVEGWVRQSLTEGEHICQNRMGLAPDLGPKSLHRGRVGA